MQSQQNSFWSACFKFIIILYMSINNSTLAKLDTFYFIILYMSVNNSTLMKLISSCSICTSIIEYRRKKFRIYGAVCFFLITDLDLFCVDTCPRCFFIFQVCAVLSCSASNLLMWHTMEMEVATYTLTPKSPHQSWQCRNSIPGDTSDWVRNRWRDRIK